MTKYDWDFTLETLDWVIVVRPRVVIAWRTALVAESGSKEFPLASGKWTFSDEGTGNGRA